MADNSTPVASNDEFRIAFQGIRTQVIAHKINPNTNEMNTFIVHQAETIAQLRATIRQLHNNQHL